MAKATLEQLIADLQQDALLMGALVESSVDQSLKALFNRDLSLVAQVAEQDLRIDRLYRKLEEDCLTVLAFHTPLARDLRHIGTLLQLSRDLERIGDYAVDICETVPHLLLYPELPEMARTRDMARRCQVMVAHALTALTELDPQAGRRLYHEDDAVDADYAILYKTLAGQQVQRGPVEPLLLLLLIIRYLERMADHATNIGSRVAFIVTGER
ncbi:phosphate signaling complex protein PhoU [Anthocerotibacter panamensis]|uniref:phosphate signaling complex protein PhoU n=1 Tax=Anthocerotibacter panamensis TaxID=2857077 RepID=UPI001C4073E3|nr:phosphate signaling complex protein PhoU [Anthocerotibacter panamensis]